MITDYYKKMFKKLTKLPENEVELIELKDFNDQRIITISKLIMEVNEMYSLTLLLIFSPYLRKRAMY